MHVYHIITVKNNVPFSIAENWNELIYFSFQCQTYSMSSNIDFGHFLDC